MELLFSQKSYETYKGSKWWTELVPRCYTRLFFGEKYAHKLYVHKYVIYFRCVKGDVIWMVNDACEIEKRICIQKW